MPKRTAEAAWRGKLQDGEGKVRLGSGAFEGPYSFSSRFEKGSGTNPEELIGAAHAGCFSMALAHGLEQAGHRAEEIKTIAEVRIEKSGEGFAIPGILLRTDARVPGISEEDFAKQARNAKDSCPVSKALAGVSIELEAKLRS